MITEEVPVPLGDKASLAAMMRDYIAAMAEVIPGIRPDMHYPEFDLYFAGTGRHSPFWLKANQENAGFALLSRQGDRTDMEEFFVAAPYRRRGIGLAAARRLILRFPGVWQITQRETNAPAIAFWHRVLDGFVAYEEITTHTDATRRQQRFVVG
jgi:predicted acetyltransferase